MIASLKDKQKENHLAIKGENGEAEEGGEESR